MKFIAQVNIEIQPIDCSMVVSLPTGDSLVADRVYMGCRVIIEAHEFRAKNITSSLGVLIRPYSYMYCTLSRDEALQKRVRIEQYESCIQNNNNNK